MKHKWYRPVLYILACWLQNCIVKLPRGSVLRLGRFSARIAFALLHKERNKTIRHLAYAYGDTVAPVELRRRAQRVFEHIALTACDFALFPRLTLAQIRAMVSLKGMEKLYEIMRVRQSGVIIITAHIGNWELLAATVIAHGYAGCVLAREIYYEGYNKLIVNLRETQGVHSVYRGQSTKEILRRLRGGEVIGILPDQDISDAEGIVTDFFGKPAHTTTGPAKLAIRAHVPILLAFMIRDNNRYNLIFDKCIDTSIQVGEDKHAAVGRITRTWAQGVERYIRQYPEQWVWMHNRWKTQNANYR